MDCGKVGARDNGNIGNKEAKSDGHKIGNWVVNKQREQWRMENATELPNARFPRGGEWESPQEHSPTVFLFHSSFWAVAKGCGHFWRL